MNIVITGATKGIGRAIAEHFAKAGATLFVCARNYEELQALKIALESLNPTATIYIKKADVSKRNEVIAFAELIKKQTDHLHILVNNAGLFLQGSMLEEEEGVLEKMIATNVYSAYHLTRALLPLCETPEKTHIFNMCSVASKQIFPNCGSYSIAKFALLGFSKALRAEVGAKNIRVTDLLPGATWSNSWAGVDLPTDRLMAASDIAQVVWDAYHLSDTVVVEEIVLRPQLGDLG